MQFIIECNCKWFITNLCCIDYTLKQLLKLVNYNNIYSSDIIYLLYYLRYITS